MSSRRSAAANPPIPPEEITFDRLAPFPELAAVRAAAQAGDWPAVAAGYSALDRWDLRYGAIRAVGETPGSEGFLEPVWEGFGDLVAGTMLAERTIIRGWAIRSGLRAKYVSSDQFAGFHDYLRQAERMLIDITARDPGNVAAWTGRLATARGLELGQSESRRRYDQVAKHDPHHLASQMQLLQQLCPKWSGSFEAVDSFARECAGASPPGSLNACLIVNAHLEHYAELSEKEDVTYLRRPDVQREVSDAAERSVLNSAFAPTYNWVEVHNYFACYYSLAGNRAGAARHFRAMQNFAVEEPWLYLFGEPQKQFFDSRAQALAKG